MVLTLIEKQRIKEIAEKYNVKLMLLFGSQISGKMDEESDVDIAILPEKTLSFSEETKLATDLANISGNLDITNMRKSSPLLLKEIIENCEVLYEKSKNEFERLEVYALQRYAEAKPIFELHKERVKEFIQKNAK